MFRNVSVKEYVTPQQLADMVVYTASPHAKTISGQAISRVRGHEHVGVIANISCKLYTL